MRSIRFVLLLLMAATAFACSTPSTNAPRPNQTATSATPQSAPSVAADELAPTRALFKEHCSKCHGETGGGGRVTIQGKEIRVPNLTGAHARKPTDEKLATKITNGDDDMPAFKDKFSPEQIQDLVRFIRKEFQSGESK
jgi:mono/diheme cytochrome c family protein